MPETRKLKTSDGLSLHVQLYAAQGMNRGSMVHVHGIDEHCGRYTYHWETIARAGINVLTFDHRGHGLSEGERPNLPEWKRLCTDVFEVVRAHRDFIGPNFFLFGHSMGGGIVTTCILERLFAPKGVILSSPALAPGRAIPLWARVGSHVLNPIFPKLALTKPYKEDVLTSIVEEQKKFATDPLIRKKSTPHNYMSIFGNGQHSISIAAQWNQFPLLLLYGGQDPLTDPVAMQTFFERVAIKDKMKHVEPEGRHELLTDTCRDRVLQTMIQWMTQRL